ncbi:transposable element Tcb2 transposase [Trichonephila clavipes]|nr:transposable element Tcb2 transposase [Trichonephila clavipes]
MSLCRFRRQYEQLSLFERLRIMCKIETGWSARRVARQIGHSHYVVKRCWDQRIRDMSFTRRPDSKRPRQSNRREDHHIERNERVQPTASSAVIQAQVEPSLGASVSSFTTQRRLEEGHLGSRCPLRVLHLTPTQRRLRLERWRARRIWTAAEWNQLLKAIFQQDNAQRHVKKYHKTISALLLPFLSVPDPQICLHSSISRYHLERRVGHLTSLNEREARLQEIWNGMSQNIIQNF